MGEKIVNLSKRQESVDGANYSGEQRTIRRLKEKEQEKIENISENNCVCLINSVYVGCLFGLV